MQTKFGKKSLSLNQITTDLHILPYRLIRITCKLVIHLFQYQEMSMIGIATCAIYDLVTLFTFSVVSSRYTKPKAGILEL